MAVVNFNINSILAVIYLTKLRNHINILILMIMLNVIVQESIHRELIARLLNF